MPIEYKIMDKKEIKSVKLSELIRCIVHNENIIFNENPRTAIVDLVKSANNDFYKEIDLRESRYLSR